ncbi:MAG: isopenicillin N synthase family oxygenase [Stigonema ocellatum SAG 48.90 = DSM 106950]|nr:isopenicillin N synthase family oxygenase [Stigonema ocellatum SAG 48.90 = DSM 106950]
MLDIPVIDFSLFTNGDATARQTVVEQIYQACHEIGFMYLENMGISIDVLEKVFTQSKYFFNLPLAMKQQQAWSHEFSNQGYIGIERERLDPNKPGDLKEAFNIGKQDEGVTSPSSPSLAKDSHILSFYEACTEVANKVLQAFALALQLPEDFFATRHDRQNHTLRLLHYPPLQQSPKLGQVRAGEHSDYGSITLLFQDEVGGLEVQTAFGEWIAASPIPGTVVVNTGDLMQRWTNHVFCSTKHRVMIPSDDRVKQSRYSVAFFCHPNDDTEIACLESCQSERSPIYPPMKAGDYLISRLQATYYTNS